MSEQQQAKENTIPTSPIKNKVGSIFIPVRDIEKSRSWYCRVSLVQFSRQRSSMIIGSS